jgi:hypothetical protein
MTVHLMAPDCSALNYMTVNNEFDKCEWNWSWKILRHGICRGGREKSAKTSIRIVSALAEIRKRHLPNESLEHDRLRQISRSNEGTLGW